MNSLRKAGIAVSLLGGMLISTAAMADWRPAECTSYMHARRYDLSYRNGIRLVDRSWQTVGANCHESRIDLFASIISSNVERLTLPSYASDYVVCAYLGTVNGVFDALDLLVDECMDVCFFDGVAVGEMIAEIYCELSIAFGGLDSLYTYVRRPVGLCGHEFEQGCDIAYFDATRRYMDQDGNSCRPYTDNTQFEDVWMEVKDEQCAYEDPVVVDPSNPGSGQQGGSGQDDGEWWEQ